jgi:hypothetical protein
VSVGIDLGSATRFESNIDCILDTIFRFNGVVKSSILISVALAFKLMYFRKHLPTMFALASSERKKLLKYLKMLCSSVTAVFSHRFLSLARCAVKIMGMLRHFYTSYYGRDVMNMKGEGQQEVDIIRN